MLYKKNGTKKLDEKLFQKPTSEYRGAPFWAWNTKLEKDELLWQIDRLKEMGLGGYHMHTRSGMNTEYLGTEFMDLIKQLLTKEPNKRLGNKGISDIKSHPFFKDINFDDFKRKHKKSPFKFKVNQNDDTSNFDENSTSKLSEDKVDDWVKNYEAIFNNFTN
jgi:serine/threonine protein kinase